MSDFTFRYKLRVSSRTFLDIDEPRLEWSLNRGSQKLELRSDSDEIPIKEAKELYFLSSGWESEEDAFAAAKRYSPALFRTLAHLRIGVDVGFRESSGGGMSGEYLAELEKKFNCRLLNDTWGLMVYKSDHRPLFISPFGRGSRNVLAPQFHSAFREAMLEVEPLQDREHISLEFFNASFFMESGDARFLMLFMALEALMDSALRSEARVAHFEHLITLTASSNALEEAERNSIVIALKWLRDKSIRQKGIKLVGRLVERSYSGKTPEEFFDYCYGLRNKLVHGHCPLPLIEKVDNAVTTLELMVSDLLAGRLREIDRKQKS